MNQVSGISPQGSTVDSLTSNPVDACIQCLPNGPDNFKSEKPIPKEALSESKDLLHKVRVKKRKQGAPEWDTESRWKTNKLHDAIVAVVTKMDGTPLDMQTLQSSTIADSMYVLPFVDSFLRRDIHQRVTLCTPKQYRHL